MGEDWRSRMDATAPSSQVSTGSTPRPTVSSADSRDLAAAVLGGLGPGLERGVAAQTRDEPLRHRHQLNRRRSHDEHARTGVGVDDPADVFHRHEAA